MVIDQKYCDLNEKYGGWAESLRILSATNTS